MASKTISLLVGTRKGAFLLNSSDNRKTWQISDPIMLGHIIYHVVADPRDRKHVVMAAKAGHLGPTVYHSADGGKSWTESKTPPQFPKALCEGGEVPENSPKHSTEGSTESGTESSTESQKPDPEKDVVHPSAETTAPGSAKARAVESVFWLTPGHASEPGKWYAGTAPAGMFISNDHGQTWEPVSGFNDHPMYSKWTKDGATPGGLLLHSINIDPRDKNHLYIGISVGGVFESTDGGKDWTPLNRGQQAEFLPDQAAEWGQDPHCIVMHPKNPDRLYQQNHCGIYRLDRPSNTWERIGKNMPSDVGDIGFPIVLDPKNPDKAWVFPMDGSDVWPRTSPGGKPAVYMTDDAGKSWKRQDAGLPASKAYFTVKRQAMCGDSEDSVGLYFGTSQGEIWASDDNGDNWKCLVSYLPEIYSITVNEG